MDKEKLWANALFTLRDEDREINGKVYPAIRRLFVETEDPTGYTFAMEHIGGWKHYKALLKSALADYIEDWQEEMEVRIRAKGIKKVIEQADKGNRQASEWIAQRKWHLRKPGAPSKEEKEGRKKQDAKLDDETEGDYNRMLTKQGNGSEARH